MESINLHHESEAPVAALRHFQKPPAGLDWRDGDVQLEKGRHRGRPGRPRPWKLHKNGSYFYPGTKMAVEKNVTRLRRFLLALASDWKFMAMKSTAAHLISGFLNPSKLMSPYVTPICSNAASPRSSKYLRSTMGPQRFWREGPEDHMLCTQSMTNVTSPQFNVASFITFTTIYLRNHQQLEFSYGSSPKPWIAYRLPSLSQHQKKNTRSSGRNSWILCDTPTNLRCARYAKMPCIFEEVA